MNIPNYFIFTIGDGHSALCHRMSGYVQILAYKGRTSPWIIRRKKVMYLEHLHLGTVRKITKEEAVAIRLRAGVEI